MITEATVKQVKYSPERIPDSWYGNVPNLAEVAPPILELRNFKPYICTLTDLQLTANANVVLRARYDNATVDENTAAMLSALLGAWRLLARDYLYCNFYGAALAPNYTTHFSLWASLPTIADKIFWGISLSDEEKALAESLGIFNTVEKGLLPLPVDQQVAREYHVVSEVPYPRSVNIAVANTVYTIDTIYPRPNEIVVLTRVAAAPGTAAQVVLLTIDRDDDANYAQLRTFALSLLTGGEVNCFIPALREIRLTTSASVAPGAHLFRYTVQRIKLNNILRVRFGLVAKDEVPGDVYDKVKGGIL